MFLFFFFLIHNSSEKRTYSYMGQIFQIAAWLPVKFQLDKQHIWKSGSLLRYLWHGFRDLTSGTSLEKSIALTCLFHRRIISTTSFFFALLGCCALQSLRKPPQACSEGQGNPKGGGWKGFEGKCLVSNKSAKPWKEGLRRNRWGARNIASEVYLLNEQKPRLSDLGQILLQPEYIYFIHGL